MRQRVSAQRERPSCPPCPVWARASDASHSAAIKLTSSVSSLVRKPGSRLQRAHPHNRAPNRSTLTPSWASGAERLSRGPQQLRQTGRHSLGLDFDFAATAFAGQAVVAPPWCRRKDLQDKVRAVPHRCPRRGPQAGPQPWRPVWPQDRPGTRLQVGWLRSEALARSARRHAAQPQNLCWG